MPSPASVHFPLVTSGKGGNEMGRGLLCSVALMVALVGPAGAALAVPVQWPVSEGGNGHYYEFIGQNFLRWEPARSAASARSFAGLPGYLATITTDAERLFVYERTTFTTDTGSDAWLGGFQAQDSPTAADGWSWVTGEPWDQTFWGAGEPFDGFPAGPDANFANHLSLFGRLREADQ